MSNSEMLPTPTMGPLPSDSMSAELEPAKAAFEESKRMQTTCHVCGARAVPEGTFACPPVFPGLFKITCSTGGYSLILGAYYCSPGCAQDDFPRLLQAYLDERNK